MLYRFGLCIVGCLILLKWPFTYTAYLCACITFYFTVVQDEAPEIAFPSALRTALAFCVGSALSTLSCLLIFPTTSSGALHARAAALTRSCGALFERLAKVGTTGGGVPEIEMIKSSVGSARFELALMTRLIAEEKFEPLPFRSPLSPSVFLALQAMVSTLSSISTTIRTQSASRNAHVPVTTSLGTQEARPIRKRAQTFANIHQEDTVMGDTIGGAELARMAREMGNAAAGKARRPPTVASGGIPPTVRFREGPTMSLAQMAAAMSGEDIGRSPIADGSDAHSDEEVAIESEYDSDAGSDMTAELEDAAVNMGESGGSGDTLVGAPHVSSLSGAVAEHLTSLLTEATEAIADLAVNIAETRKPPYRSGLKAISATDGPPTPPNGRRYSTIPVHHLHQRNASVASILSPMRDGFDDHQAAIVEHLFEVSGNGDPDAARLMDINFVFGFFEYLRQLRRLEFSVKVPVIGQQPSTWQNLKRAAWRAWWGFRDWLPHGDLVGFLWLSRRSWELTRFVVTYEYRFAIKVSFAVTLFSVLALVGSTRDWYLEWKGKWAIITIFAIASPTHAGVLISGVQRTLGTVLGALIAIAAFEACVGSPYVFSVLAVIFMAPLFLIKYHGDPDYMKAATVSVLTFSVVAIPQWMATHYSSEPAPNILRIAYQRVLMITLGGLLTVVINRMIWPRLARVELRKSLGETIEGVGTLYAQLASSFMTRRRFTQAETDRIEDLEQRLQLRIIQERVLLFLARREPRAQGPFPHHTFHELIRSLQFVVDLLRSTRVVLTQTHFNEELDESHMLLLDADRVQMFRNVLVLIWIIRAALKMKAPLPAYLPDCVSPRVRLNEKFLKLRAKYPSDTNAWATLAFYSYSFAMTLIIWRLEKVALAIKSLYGEMHGVEGLSSTNFEDLMRQLDAEYIGEKYGKTIVPVKGSREYARYLTYMYWTVVNLDSCGYPLYVQLAFTPENKRDKKGIEDKIKQLYELYLPQLEGLLKEFGGPYLLGKELTALDIQVGPVIQALNHPRVQLLKNNPVILNVSTVFICSIKSYLSPVTFSHCQYLNILLERPAFRVAHRLKPKL
ncbi:hypothetical protein HDU93_008637 [Gonapodya sp. JEL0774]|nr:hypothetical protein HDU93_008637 [Gonapodya sp. JEL0774]